MAMTMEQLLERLAKAQENVAKVEKTIARHQARLEKLTSKLVGYKYQTKEEFWDADEEYKKSDIGNENRWLFFDIRNCQEDIESNTKKLKEKQETVENWQEKIRNQEATFDRIKELPQALQSFHKELVEKWDKHDEHKAQLVKEARKRFWDWENENPNSGYKERREMEKRIRYSISTEVYYLEHDAEYWHKENVYNANILIINLIARVEKKVGEITEYSLYLMSGNENEGTVLNGLVRGTKGVAKVESIIAGGWNIQKEHIRTLVK